MEIQRVKSVLGKIKKAKRAAENEMSKRIKAA
jgi:hypothetical protein